MAVGLDWQLTCRRVRHVGTAAVSREEADAEVMGVGVAMCDGVKQALWSGCIWKLMM